MPASRNVLWGDTELAKVWRPRNVLQWATLNCPAILAMMGGTAGSYKALDLNTPIPTPDGWSTIGALRAGDLVFDNHGNACSVTGLSEIFHDQPAYELHFSDGESIIASSDHRWKTMSYEERMEARRFSPEWRAQRRARRSSRAIKNTRPWLSRSNSSRSYVLKEPPAGTLRTTAEIAATVLTRGTRVNHSIATAEALNLPCADLSVDPYVLGAWLGDGTAAHGGITCNDSQIIEEIREAGYSVSRHSSRYGWGILRLLPKLRVLNLLRNKHIPFAYLRASAQQRLALLQGLMDTDGSCSKSGSCIFVNTNEALVSGVLELVKTMGIKATANRYPAVIAGRTIGWSWQIRFSTTLPVFRLRRKLDRLSKCQDRATNQRRYIVSVLEVPSRPTRCITVSSPSHLFLAGRGFIPTHNSETLIVEPLRYRKHSFAKGVIFRNTRPELNQLIERARAIYTPLGAKENVQQKIFKFPSGASILFDYLDREDHQTRQFSQEYDYIGFDESTRNKRGMARIRFMFSRLRSKDPFLQKRTRMRLGTNPGGPGNNDHKHVFIGPRCCHCGVHGKRGFVEGARIPGRIYYDATWPGGDPITVDPEYPISTVFIPGRLDEANILGRQYAANLKTLPAFLQQALLTGCWDITEGQYFDIWNELLMCVPRPGIGEQYWWPHWISIDYGFMGSHASAHLHCMSPEGVIFTIGEIIKEHMLAADFAVLVTKQWVDGKRNIVAWYGGPDLWNKIGDGHQRADQMMQAAKINLTKASTDRVGGAMLMYQLLRDGKWKIADTCKEAARAIPWAVHDSGEHGNPDDVMKVRGELLDDVYDDLRYGLYSYIGPAEKPPEVRIAEAVTAKEPTVRAIQAQMAEAKIRKEQKPLIVRRGRWRN